MSLKNIAREGIGPRTNGATFVTGKVAENSGFVNTARLSIIRPSPTVTMVNSASISEGERALMDAVTPNNIYHTMPTEVSQPRLFDDDNVQTMPFNTQDFLLPVQNNTDGDVASLSKNVSTTSTLNTPVIEIPSLSFPKVTASTPAFTLPGVDTEEVLFETVCNVSDSPVIGLHAANLEGISDEWNLVEAAPLRAVEGYVEPQDEGLGDSLTFDQSDDVMVNDPVLQEATSTSEPILKVEPSVKSEEILQSAIDCANIVQDEDYQFIMEKIDMNDVEMGQLWSDTLQAPSASDAPSGDVEDADQLGFVNVPDNFIASPPEPTVAQINVAEKLVVRPARRRGRPPVPYGRNITPRVPRSSYRTDSADTSCTEFTDQENDQKYRRMRDLNNEASKRCRQKRKEKQEQEEQELHALQSKNLLLKRRLANLEAKLLQLKPIMSQLMKPVSPESLVKVEQVLSKD